jgi:hypothetical protein
MDLLEAKSRIAEALVESIFRRARYEVQPYEAGALALRFGREDFSPNFSAAMSGANGARPQRLVEVKYRPYIEQFISVENQRGERSVFALARRQWPSLCFILVTDHPEPGRSCFQAIPLDRLSPGDPAQTADLDQLTELCIFRNNVEYHEELVRRIMGLLTSA